MVILAGLAACGGSQPVPNTVRGVQVVAVESIPPNPEPLDGLRLRAWVADGTGRGADVLVWVCTPYEDRCVEAFPPGSTGLPLSIWTRTGRADPVFTADAGWPLLASIAIDSFDLPPEIAGRLVVWTLACSPGVCPVIEQVAANPVSGSEAWERVAAALATPQEWIGDLPKGQVSLSVKVVPVWFGEGFGDTGEEPPSPYETDVTTTGPQGQNHAPSLLLATGELLGQLGVPEGHADLFLAADPDGDALSVRSFVTAGGVVTNPLDSQGLFSVLWQDPRSPLRAPVGFVVVDDSRGGSAVWSTATSGCEPGVDVAFAGDRVGDGDPIELVVGSYYRPAPTITLSLDGRVTDPTIPWVVTVTAFDGTLLGQQQVTVGGWSSGTCQADPMQAAVSLFGDSNNPFTLACKLGGTPVHLVVRPVTDGAAPLAEVDAVLTLPDSLECTE
ncbi:MAG: hypothetical protein ABMA64_15985 [Myxococcota bacterium]